MTDLYLIAHKVRGEPAFDVAQRICEGEDICQVNCGLYPECKQEDIWIIPTSGHRAYPYWYLSFEDLRQFDGYDYYGLLTSDMPPDLPDHYTTHAAPAEVKASGAALLAKLLPKKPFTDRRL